MPMYRTRLFDTEPHESGEGVFRARGWRAEYRFLDLVDASPVSAAEIAHELHHQTIVLDSRNLPDGRWRVVYAPEIILTARSRIAAQRALNLIHAAKTLLDGDFTFGDPFTAVPDDVSLMEDLSPSDYDDALNCAIGTSGFGSAAALAAKTTRRRRWQYALIKYWLSLRTCSIPWIEHHPIYGDQHTVEIDPINHAIMAQAITSAYSAIEDLNLNIICPNGVQSKNNGKWNPVVLTDLLRRLCDAGVDTTESFVWILRNTPTRIERVRPPPSGKRALWACRGVYDREVELVEALHNASFLRSKVSAHSMHRLTKSLTIHHVINVQHLVRRLLLEALGYWKPMRRRIAENRARFQAERDGWRSNIGHEPPVANRQ